MKLSPEAVLQVMALADGELEAEERAHAERLVMESEEARELLDGFRSPLVAVWLAAEVEQRAAAADGIADRVMARVMRESAEERVLGLADARAKKKRLGAAPVAFAALSLAAGVAILMGEGEREVGESAPVASIDLPAPEPPEPSASAMSQRGPMAPGVEVDGIDSPFHDVSVFEMPPTAAANAKGPSNVVILKDDPGAK
jgi:hypothetical protein